MAARVFERIAFLAAACLAVVRVLRVPTAPFDESASPSILDGPSCVSSNDEDSSCNFIAFLQVGIEVNNSAVRKGVAMKSAKASTRGLDTHSRLSRSGVVTQRAMAFHTKVRQLFYESLQASMTSGGLALLVIGIAVLAMLVAIWMTLPEEEVDEVCLSEPRLPLTTQLLDGSASLLAGAAHLARNYGNAGASNFWPAEEVPPICKQLILPKKEVRFQINMSELLHLTVDSKLEIKGSSGRTLLNATLVVDGENRVLQICVGAEDDLRTTVKATPGEENLVLCGKSEEEYYGTIEPILDSPTRGSVLKHKGVPVMNIEKGDPADLHMIAVSVRSQRDLASAGQVTSDVPRPMQSLIPVKRQWKVNVIAGADAVLIASCMLGIMLLKDGVNELS